uniref:Uncharacterized protein n=1 Tax=Leersia perrieri TaxID=77586 RepID=A0A0D9XLF0_9ORYZ
MRLMALSPGRKSAAAAHARTASQPACHHHPAIARLAGGVGGAVAEAAAAIAAASEAVFLACAAMSSATAAPRSRTWLARLRVVTASKKVSPEIATATAEALERLEERIGELENGSEKVFRRLLQTRVSLLNIHNPL